MPGESLTILGLMSGTSADGIDGAIIHLGTQSLLEAARTVQHHHIAYSAEQRNTLLRLFDPALATSDVLCAANFELGEWFADAARATARATGLSLDQIDLIGSHGQTIYHRPARGAAPGSTLQIGEPAVIAERTGITTVADFRVRDVAAGGQGAPLVSYVDSLLFQHPTDVRAVLNLGGIANVTMLPPGGSAFQPIAFDTGPANMVVDWLAQHVSGGRLHCDRDGQLAARGAVDEPFLLELLQDGYFAAPAPKTTGRERYGARYAAWLYERGKARGLSDVDIIATATALTAASVAGGIRAAGEPAGPVQEVITGGGGTNNPTLMAFLRQRLPGVRLTTHEGHGVSSQAKEALSFAILASAAVRGVVNTIPTCTGAPHTVVMGKIVPGANFVRLMSRLHGTRADGTRADGTRAV